MAEGHVHQPSFSVRGDQPLIGVIAEEEGQEVVRYFVDDQAADAASRDDSIQRALRLAGAWSDLDWHEMEQALTRIRHESHPTPPIMDL